MPSPPRRPRRIALLIGAALAIGLVNAAIYVYGLTLPGEWSVEESVVVAAPPEAVYPLLATPKRWPEWTTWSEAHDPSLQLVFTGTESGEGAGFSWLGERLGRGSLTIDEAKPNEFVGYDLSMQGTTFSENGRITLRPVAGGTRVTWTDGGEVGGTLGRLFRGRLEESVASDFAASLERLKSATERRDGQAGRPEGRDTTRRQP